jgi:hypothetical protein
MQKSSVYDTIKRVLRDSESFQAWLYELRLKRFKSKEEEQEYLKEVFKQFNFTWEARKGDEDYREPSAGEESI